MYIDAHCHLERGTYGDPLATVIQRAADHGVDRLVAVGAGGVAQGAIDAQQLAAANPQIFAAVGIHPHDAHRAVEADFAAIDALLAAPKVVALGEVGLDYYYDAHTKDVQKQVLRRFVAMAKRHNQPLMLHIREAHADARQILDEEGMPAAGGMVHCFTAGWEEAQAYLARGMMLSIPGVVTFKNAAPLRAAVPQIPADRLLLETDSPYLAPVPHRGKRNEPAFLVDTAAAVAALRGETPAALAASTTANAEAFFRLPPPPPTGP